MKRNALEEHKKNCDESADQITVLLDRLADKVERYKKRELFQLGVFYGMSLAFLLTLIAFIAK